MISREKKQKIRFVPEVPTLVVWMIFYSFGSVEFNRYACLLVLGLRDFCCICFRNRVCGSLKTMVHMNFPTTVLQMGDVLGADGTY